MISSTDQASQPESGIDVNSKRSSRQIPPISQIPALFVNYSEFIAMNFLALIHLALHFLFRFETEEMRSIARLVDSRLTIAFPPALEVEGRKPEHHAGHPIDPNMKVVTGACN